MTKDLIERLCNAAAIVPSATACSAMREAADRITALSERIAELERMAGDAAGALHAANLLIEATTGRRSIAVETTADRLDAALKDINHGK